jgi:hypothetical protein
MSCSCVSLSLSGRAKSITLGGKGYEDKKPVVSVVVPIDVREIELLIMNTIILPLVSSQWKTLQENLFLVDLLKGRLDYYYSLYKLPQLLVYKDILIIFKNVLNEHMHLINMEKQMYGACKNNMLNVVYKTSMIRLKPEYSLYNLIVGPPVFSQNQTYNVFIINDILYLLTLNNITFQIIKDFIVDKYDIVSVSC